MVFWVLLLSLSLLLLFKKLASLMLGQKRTLQDGEAELEWLQRTLLRLRATIRDAERKHIKDEGLVLWVQEIKDVVCDAEDVIDEVEYEQLRHKVEDAGTTQSRGSSGSSVPPLSKDMVHRINQIRRRLEGIAKERNDLRTGDLDGWSDRECAQKRMLQTSSLQTEGQVFGREKEKEEIINLLLAADDETAPSTIAITGIGGLGKTTLAQLVYNDSRVQEHFKRKMWVSMTADYDVLRLTREILSSNNHCREIFFGLENLDVYHRRLVEKLEGQRFLLVIDNLWDRDHRKWQSLRTPLLHGGEGSRILITTRDAKVANIFQARKTIRLEGLPFHHCWMLFKRYAFFNGNSGEHPSLEAIGKRIVEKFKGVPLAAITIGSLLYPNLDEREWMRILESEMWELEHGEDDILSALRLSYEHLPPQMKQCFVYFSLFPKNQEFGKLELVQQWMAQGILEARGSARMEDVGTEYFDDLLSRSFLQGARDNFHMHDLIHDLALLISQRGHLFTGNDRSHKIPKDSHKLRHLSLVMANGQPDQEDLERLSRYGCLRTLAFFFPYWNKFQIPRGLFLIHSLKTLRVLDLSSGDIDELPDSIGNLKQLRYLDLRSNAFRRLPETLCCLYKLQTLKLEYCSNLEKLPQGISKLINLRHLEVEPYLLSGVVGIGKLTGLQELESFLISEGHGIRIDDLKDMNELRGELSICNLDRVRSKEEAQRAMLHSKRHLHRLEMKWGKFPGGANKQLEEQVLEALTPPAGLKEFAIEGYDGDNFPSWLEQQYSLSKLESISLGRSRNWKSLPLFWGLPFVQRIYIYGCPQLRNLPSLPSTLKELGINTVGLEDLPELYQPSQSMFGSCNDISPSLSILRICRCPVLRSLRRGLLRHHLWNLTVLDIQDCEQLEYWPEGVGFQATLYSLQETLWIINCPKLEAFPNGSILSASIKDLRVTGCPGIPDGSLFAQLHKLSWESDIYVRKGYPDLVCCYEEALQRMKRVEWLMIDEFEDHEYDLFGRKEDIMPFTLVCDKGRVWSWRCDDWVLAWRVRICGRRSKRTSCFAVAQGGLPHKFVPPEQWWRRRSPPAIERRTGAPDVDDDQQQCNSFVLACIGRHHLSWASSLRWLVANGTSSHAALLSLNLASLEGLWISHYRGTRALLTHDLLARLQGLKELQIFDCPMLTLSSLKEVIRSLPSLQHMTIDKCPKLSSSSSSPPPPRPLSVSTSSSIAATIQSLFVDDAKLLGHDQFLRGYLSSLRGLHIWHDDLTSFTAAMKEGLRSVGHSIQHLSLWSCSNLRHLPSDLRSLLPSLKALSIGSCPMFQRLPTERLPAWLEILVIHDCPLLEERCRPPHSQGQGVQQQQQTDWPKIAHIRVIVNNGYIVQGSEREFEELRAKWRDF